MIDNTNLGIVGQFLIGFRVQVLEVFHGHGRLLLNLRHDPVLKIIRAKWPLHIVQLLLQLGLQVWGLRSDRASHRHWRAAIVRVRGVYRQKIILICDIKRLVWRTALVFNIYFRPNSLRIAGKRRPLPIAVVPLLPINHVTLEKLFRLRHRSLEVFSLAKILGAPVEAIAEIDNV